MLERRQPRNVFGSIGNFPDVFRPQIAESKFGGAKLLGSKATGFFRGLLKASSAEKMARKKKELRCCELLRSRGISPGDAYLVQTLKKLKGALWTFAVADCAERFKSERLR